MQLPPHCSACCAGGVCWSGTARTVVAVQEALALTGVLRTRRLSSGRHDPQWVPQRSWPCRADRRSLGRPVQTDGGQQGGKPGDAQAKAAQIKADTKSGKLTREEAIKQLQSIGYK